MEIESKLHLVDWIILSVTLLFIVAYGTYVTRKNANVQKQNIRKFLLPFPGLQVLTRMYRAFFLYRSNIICLEASYLIRQHMKQMFLLMGV